MRESPIKRMWELASLLKDPLALQSACFRSPNREKVLYEDSYQIVVEEWKQLKTTP